MRSPKACTRHKIGVGLLTAGVLFGLMLSFLFLVHPVFAEPSAPAASVAAEIAAAAAEGGCVATAPCPPLATKQVLEKTLGQMIGPMLKATLLTATVDIAQFTLDTIAYNTAVWLASGDKGQNPLFHRETAAIALNNFGADVLGEAVGAFSEAFTLDDYFIGGLNLCAPKAPSIRLGFQLSIKGVYEKPKAKCDWQDIKDNWGGFIDKAQSHKSPSEYVMNQFAEGLRPGKSGLSFAVQTNSQVLSDFTTKKQAEFAAFLASGGVKSKTDIVTGSVTTPSALIKAESNKALVDDKRKGQEYSMQAVIENSDLIGTMFRHTASVFLNTLLSQLMNRIYTGLFPAVDLTIDPFGSESADIAGREEAQERFSTIVAAHPTVINQYNVLSEFVVCPTAPAIRQINNCVMDASFFQAASRSEAGEIMTVERAIEEGLLHEDWPLFSSNDVSRNQDPFCYTYGYCYGNLVKMRKARVISVGWELAAASEKNVVGGAPVTLREVVDGFDDCNSDGKLDGSHPWCHLIDPNWVLKYPTTQCRASVIGSQLVSTLSTGRAGTCVDTPSCVSEDENGTCNGYGYCVQEKNSWKFRGDECPEQYASCLAFTNTDTSETGAWLMDTLDFGVCSANNAGCLWYRTNQYLDDAGSPDDASDDSYQWLPSAEAYVVSERDDDVLAYDSDGNVTARTGYDSNDDGTADYNIYAFEDRVYFNNNVEACSQSEAGCSQLFAVSEKNTLNIIRNSSFETDEDKNQTADFWKTYGSIDDDFVYDEAGSHSFHGTDSYALLSSSGVVSQENIPLQQGLFYSLSFYVKSVAGSAASAKANVDLVASDNSDVSAALAGLSATCQVSGSTVTLNATTDEEIDDFQSFDCAFTTPILSDPRLGLVATLNLSGDDVYVDGIQLEVGEQATDYHDGYAGGTPASTYLKVAPDWLSCTGEATDAAACASYALVCSATEVGCSLYTPIDGDPAVPAVVSALDACPAECAGYATFKQEATPYEPEEFPLYFIPDSAAACNEEHVGCDQFTNLETEEIQTFSSLRACVTPEMNQGNVYFTWEGSDAAGYQLVSFELLPSNATSGESVVYTQDTDGDGTDDVADADYPNQIFIDDAPELAPCTTWDVTGESTLSCDDDLATLAADDRCNEHNDIFEDPDCREFYDEAGNIHYRRYAETISVIDACTAFRKTVSTQSDCEASGGFWTSAGECRYFAAPDESQTCPATAAGCRAFTGGSGRNASTILNDTFETGTFSDFMDSGRATLTISNESIATDGHSLRAVTNAKDSGFKTLQAYYDSANHANTCPEEDGCEVTGIGSYNSSCTIPFGQESCGTLTQKLVPGKTYLVKFWAKGSTNASLKVAFLEDGGSSKTSVAHDFVHPENTNTSTDSLARLALDGGWQLFELGPVDTSKPGFEKFNENAVLAILAADSNTTFYTDNIELIEAEENITLIKDSWVTPSTCDQSPSGADAPQFYLGCEEYADQNDAQAFIYQFSHLCSQSAVGCEAFSDAQNSASAYAQVFNASCFSADGNPVGVSTACELDGETVCTIPAGSDQCQFDVNGALPTPLPTNIVLGPETVVVPADEQRFLINDGSATCTDASRGCTEVGLPQFTQDKTAVQSFESAYFVNLPDSYENILCSNEALFCEEWASTQDGNFFFKNPSDQACEYKTGVKIGSVTYAGWFRAGSTEFCYGSGTCSGNASFTCETDADCAAKSAGTCNITSGSYIAGGDYSGIWSNGDTLYYEGWAGVCDTRYDLCSEFIDHLDTGTGSEVDGVSYFFLDNASLSSENTQAAEPCNGQVSLKKGCVLFDDKLESGVSQYAAAPSYLISEHADLFFGDEPQSLIDPVSCDEDEAYAGGVFTLTTGEVVNVCKQRCQYISSKFTISEPGIVSANATTYYGAACLNDQDCPIVQDAVGNEVEGVCDVLTANRDEFGGSSSSDETTYIFQNDANRVLKVYRDRTCAEWLSCESSQTVWDDVTGSWRSICESVDLCDQYATSTDSTYCTSWVKEEPLVLTPEQYSSRNVSWYGQDYAGYAIPNQLPVQFYTQADVNPEKYCVNAANSDDDIVDGTPKIVEGDIAEEYVACGSNADCSGYPNYPTCSDAPNDYRLAYPAGSCSQSNGASCLVGFCENSGVACGKNTDCTGSGEACITGYCKTTDSDSVCDENDDCEDEYTCEQGVCVDLMTGSDDSQQGCRVNSECTRVNVDSDDELDTECDSAVPTKQGACYNSLCLVDIYGTPFEKAEAPVQECRGFPESNAPFSPDVVEEWLEPNGAADGVQDGDLLTADDVDCSRENCDERATIDVTPYNYTAGFPQVPVCSPYINSSEELVLDDQCECSYDKAEYGTGAYRYYPLGTNVTRIQKGICQGGDTPGAECASDSECDLTGTGGASCEILSRKDSHIGWLGFCIERDSSIYVNGGHSADHQACLTWFTVDQLQGQTDLYAQYVNAGYPLKDTYFCSEVGYYVDLYGVGVKFMDDTSGDTDKAAGLTIMCAEDEIEKKEACDWGEYNECLNNVACPEGYVAALGYCDSDGTEDEDALMMCDDGEDACPYFCIPDFSYHGDVDDNSDDFGRPCIPDLQALAQGDGKGESEGYGLNAKNVMVYKVGDIDGDNDRKIGEDYVDCVVRGVAMNNDFYSSPTKEIGRCSVKGGQQAINVICYGIDNNQDKIDDTCAEAGFESLCVASGNAFLGSGITGDPVTPWFFPQDNYVTYGDEQFIYKTVDNKDNDPDDDYIDFVKKLGFVYVGMDLDENGTQDVGYDTRSSGIPYLGCNEVVQVSKADLDNDSSYDVNRAWTDRVWEYDPGYPTKSAATEGGFQYAYEYTDPYTQAYYPSFFGEAAFQDYYTPVDDPYTEQNMWVIDELYHADNEIGLYSFPMPIFACNEGSPDTYTIGLQTSPPGYVDSCSYLWNYPTVLSYAAGYETDDNPDPYDIILHTDDLPNALAAPFDDLVDADEVDAFYNTLDQYQYDQFGSSSNSNPTAMSDSLTQLFGKIYNIWEYEWRYGYPMNGAGGFYREKSLTEIPNFEAYKNSEYDISATGDNYDVNPSPPMVAALAECYGTDCVEGEENTMTVNAIDSGTIEASGGSKHVSVKFFAWADPNQMPIKNVIVDWGDGDQVDQYINYAWPPNSQFGSIAENNYYRNHRGFEAQDDPICGDNENWGETTDACDTGYFHFQHDYVCTQGMAAIEDGTLPDCRIDQQTDRLITSPCTGGEIKEAAEKCLFQPRVHVRDNWGWCTGYCPGGADGTDGCYDGSESLVEGYNECEFEWCPSEGAAPSEQACADSDSQTINPWVNFDGYIIVDWRQPGDDEE